MRSFTAYVEKDPETHIYVGTVHGVPGAHSQGVTLEELRENLKEVLALCLEDCDDDLDCQPIVVGLQQVATAVFQ